MTKPEVINLFTNRTKMKYIKNIATTISGSLRDKIVSDFIDTYLADDFIIKENFKYNIIIGERDFAGNVFSKNKYINIHEHYRCKRTKPNNKIDENVYKIGFFVDDIDMNDRYNNSDYLFRETLNIDVVELEKLISESSDQKVIEEFLKNEMKLKVIINEKIAKYDKIKVDKDGIDIVISTENNKKYELNETNMEVAFDMPFLKSGGKLWISICEPTYSPEIMIKYPMNFMKISLIPFFNCGFSSANATQFENTISIEFDEKWILPMSGAVVFIEPYLKKRTI